MRSSLLMVMLISTVAFAQDYEGDSTYDYSIQLQYESIDVDGISDALESGNLLIFSPLSDHFEFFFGLKRSLEQGINSTGLDLGPRGYFNLNGPILFFGQFRFGTYNLKEAKAASFYGGGIGLKVRPTNRFSIDFTYEKNRNIEDDFDFDSFSAGLSFHF